MALAGIIESIIENLLPTYAHDFIGSMDFGLGGSKAPTNASFTKAYSFVIPLCAVMGVFCVLLMVFIGVCIWFERTHEVPDDDEDRARKSRQGRSETEDEENAQDEVESRGGRRGRSAGTAGDGGEGGDVASSSRRRGGRRPSSRKADSEDGAEMAQRPRHSARMSRQQSALFNMDPSFYKKTSSTAPSFRKPPLNNSATNYNNNNTNNAYHSANPYSRPAGAESGEEVAFSNNPALEPASMRRRSSQPGVRSHSLDNSVGSPPTIIAQLQPPHPHQMQYHLTPQQQQQYYYQQQQGRGNTMVTSPPPPQQPHPYSSHHGGQSMNDQNLYFGASTSSAAGSPPSHGVTEGDHNNTQRPPQRPLSSMADPLSPKKTHEEVKQQQQEGQNLAQQNPLGSTTVNPLAPSSHGSRAPSVRHFGDGSPNNSRTHNSASVEPEVAPHLHEQQQQQQPAEGQSPDRRHNDPYHAHDPNSQQQQAPQPQHQQQQQQQPMYNYDNVYGGYSQAAAPYATGPYMNTYGYPASRPSQDGGSNMYGYPQDYARNGRNSAGFLPPFGNT